jgi:hypothetical protein
MAFGDFIDACINGRVPAQWFSVIASEMSFLIFAHASQMADKPSNIDAHVSSFVHSRTFSRSASIASAIP